jgi:hypothetical protein
MILRGLYSAGYPLFEKFGSRVHEFKNIKSLIIPLIPLLAEIFAGDSGSIPRIYISKCMTTGR